MSQTTVLVVCRACAGTGLGLHNDAGYREDCGECLGQAHVCVNRARDGGLPDGEIEWRGCGSGLGDSSDAHHPRVRHGVCRVSVCVKRDNRCGIGALGVGQSRTAHQMDGTALTGTRHGGNVGARSPQGLTGSRERSVGRVRERELPPAL